MLTYADLCTIEVSLHALDPLARDLVQLLVDNLNEARHAEERAVERLDRVLETARDHAKDAKIHLDRLREYIEEAPVAADQAADGVERELDGLEDLLEGLDT